MKYFIPGKRSSVCLGFKMVAFIASCISSFICFQANPGTSSQGCCVPFSWGSAASQGLSDSRMLWAGRILVELV